MQGVMTRFWVLFAVMLMLCLVVTARVVYVHVYMSDFLVKEGEKHYKRNIPLYADRGTILDRNGRELAVSTPSVSVWVDPSDLMDNFEQASELFRLIGVDEYRLKKRIEDATTNFLYVARQVRPNIIEEVKKLGLDYVGLINEKKRVYPEGAVFSHVVGITDIDGRGIEGIELSFNDYLTGRNGLKSVLKDRLGRRFEVLDVIEQKADGSPVKLSIDRNIQYTAYTEMMKAVNYHGALSGSAVVVDVKRRKILSLVNFPSYNPNSRDSMQPEFMRNRSLSDSFEPGSSVKPFMMAAALEANVVSAGDVIDVSPGYIDIGGKKVRDARNYKRLTPASVLKKSSNVGIVKITAGLDNAMLESSLRDYGFSAESGIELSGEVGGLLKPSTAWEDTYKSFLSFGYGLSVTTLQLANVYTTLASGGLRSELSIIDSKEAPPPVMRVMSEGVARQVIAMLEGVVSEDGTGSNAVIKGYRVAGKTGTAKKLTKNLYEEDRYVSIFCGLAPAEDPQLVMVVMIDDPTKNGYYGSQVAAPVFARVMSRVLRYLEVPPDTTLLGRLDEDSASIMNL